MFSFHKPKVYRSTQGCCICKAKSSSSRFTDSKKYELDFIECFQLGAPRQGEICNACVLLVKRFKRLPPDSDRNWGHVVDARVGPGLKSMTKFKKRKEELLQQQNGVTVLVPSSMDNAVPSHTQTSKPVSSCVSEKFGKIFRKTKALKPKLLAIVAENHLSSDDMSSPSHITEFEDTKHAVSSLFCHEQLDDIVTLHSKQMFKKNHRKSGRVPQKNYRQAVCASLLDDDAWTKIRSNCCRSVYENRSIGAILVDTTNPSGSCIKCSEATKPKQTATAATKVVVSPNSSDARTINVSAVATGRIFTNGSALISGQTTANGTRTIKINTSGMVLYKRGNVESLQNCVGKLVTIKAANSPTTESGQPRDMVHIFNKNAMIEATNGHKFNDNSSDSGYDEILNEPNANKNLNIMRPLILPNGLKLHVQPQNLSNVSKITDQVLSQSTQQILTSTSSKLLRQPVLLTTTTNKPSVPTTGMTFLSQNKIIKLKVGHP